MIFILFYFHVKFSSHTLLLRLIIFFAMKLMGVLHVFDATSSFVGIHLFIMENLWNRKQWFWFGSTCSNSSIWLSKFWLCGQFGSGFSLEQNQSQQSEVLIGL